MNQRRASKGSNAWWQTYSNDEADSGSSARDGDRGDDIASVEAGVWQEVVLTHVVL